MTHFMKRLQEEWVCSAPDWVTKDRWTPFCGLELLSGAPDGKDLHVSQPLEYLAGPLTMGDA